MTIKTEISPRESLDLEMLSKLTGFPVELIKSEVFSSSSPGDLCLESLRSAMLKYVDSVFLTSDEDKKIN